MKMISLICFIAITALSTSIDISIITGEKLFNKNTPVIINLTSQDVLKKNSNVDLICVIDISGSMQGEKIELVKDSLLTLAKLMSTSDRLGIVLFSNEGQVYYDLAEMNPMNKKQLEEKIKEISPNGGTNILSGLREGIKMIKEQANVSRTIGMILLSDGLDNQNGEYELKTGLRELSKGVNIPFTLHTFGYGNDHDAQVMNILATLRDGSFYYVEKIEKVKEYFVNVFGAFMSVISTNAKVVVESRLSPIRKVFGVEMLYDAIQDDFLFETSILQFIGGKEYTYVLELDIPNGLKIGSELLSVTLSYEDLTGKSFTQTEKLFVADQKNNKPAEEQRKKANEEYVRAETYDKIQQAMTHREEGETAEAKSLLETMSQWLSSNYKGEEHFLDDINESTKSIDEYEQRGKAYMTSTVSEMQMKRGGSAMHYSNENQKQLLTMI